MQKRKWVFLLISAFFFLSTNRIDAQFNLTGPVDYEKLFAENLSRGVLNLSGKKIGDEGLKILLKQGFIKKLKKLDLRYNDISPKGAKILAQSQPLPKLQTLIVC